MVFKHDYRYAVLKYIVDLGFRFNFRKLVYIDKKNIPDDVPIIFAPTHRNAVMDGLAEVYISSKKQVVFLARADIFGNKFVDWLLEGLKILPIYRLRDGQENLDKNVQIFKDCKTVLDNGNALCLFPEAKHNPKQSLLPLQKGIARIAIQTEALSDFKQNINIVPVSIFYTEKQAFLSDVYVTFGQPIKVSEYKKYYEENPNLAVNQLRNDLDARLRLTTVDISNDPYYNFYTYCLDLAGEEVAKKHFPKDKDRLVKAYRAIDNKLDDLYENDRPKFLEITDDFGRAYSILRSYHLDTKDKIKKPKTCCGILLRILSLIISLPIALYGFINTIFPILIYILLRKKIKDVQFIASIRTVLGIVALPIFYVLQAVILGIVTHNWLWALYYFISMPLTFYFASYWRKWCKQIPRMIKVRKFARRHKEDWEYVLSVTKFEI
ncbi:1-acyl-sn-glycerol-3-phosphate acyltransferase [Odoribacter sp. OttesenSCG-928-L07]|nr:1-acyl-sn-glycerol-3-phosphate acyltransferase [Odoribacter sp. OttesenSCG-928-L07]MDL2241258.1 1-acyl-sn-glycerol-3-phosphate acyltransferase [Bacteroidales bacterium OttesenSCG-928-K22]